VSLRRNPNLSLLLFIVSRLPDTLHNAIDDLVDIAPFNPDVLNTRLIMSGDNGLLDNYR
jgi:hypothetical protein